MNFLNLKPETFGLDISESSLKIAKLKKRERFFSLVSFGETKLKPGTIEGGEIKDETSLVESIKEGLDSVAGKKIKTKYVVASLPEQKGFLQVIQMPHMKEEELQTSVLFEAENYVPLPLEEVYLDFQTVRPVRNHLDHFDILIAAFPKKIVNSYTSCIKKAGLILKAIEIESQSICRALIRDSLSPFPVFIVNIGDNITNFIVYSGFSLRFTSSIPISSSGLTRAISKALKVDLVEAEKLKIKCGLSEDKKEVFNAIFPDIINLAEQIKKCISYYQSHASHEHLKSDRETMNKIILCGRGANLKGLPEFIFSELGIPVELGNPWINILPEPLKEVPELSFKDSLGYTTALGLALRGILYD